MMQMAREHRGRDRPRARSRSTIRTTAPLAWTRPAGTEGDREREHQFINYYFIISVLLDIRHLLFDTGVLYAEAKAPLREMKKYNGIRQRTVDHE